MKGFLAGFFLAFVCPLAGAAVAIWTLGVWQ
jgi:hypothetical protein